MTVRELQQTLVEGLKAAHEDGKLTKDEIAMLGKKLLEETVKKMSAPAADLLAAAAVDLNALIRGAGESWIIRAHKAPIGVSYAPMGASRSERKER